MLHPLTGRGRRTMDDDRRSSRPRTTSASAERDAAGDRRASRTSSQERLAQLERQGKLLEAQRLRMRTDVRPRDDAADRLLQRHRELLAPHRRPRAGRAAAHAARLLPRRLPRRHRRVARQTVPQIGGMYEGDRSRKGTLVEHGFRLPERARQPAAALRRVPGARRPDGVPLGHARAATSSSIGRRRRRADRPARPASIDPQVVVKPTKGQIDDLHRGDPRARRARRARARHDAHQEDGRGPHRLPRSSTASACATCTPRSTRSQPHRDPARPARSASSTCWSASTCSARASTCPRCRWSRSSTPTRRASCARETSLDPDDRPRRPQRRRARCTCTPTRSPTRCERPSSETNRRREKQVAYNTEPRHRPAAAAQDASPTSPRCSPARAPTPTGSCGAGPRRRRRSGKGKSPDAAPAPRRASAAEGAEPAGGDHRRPHRPDARRRPASSSSSSRRACATRCRTSRRSCARWSAPVTRDARRSHPRGSRAVHEGLRPRTVERVLRHRRAAQGAGTLRARTGSGVVS